MSALISQQKRLTFNFVLEVADIDVSKDQFEDGLYEAGLSDALVLIDGSRLLLDVDREAATLDDAIASAVKDVTRAGGTVVNVQPCDD